MPACPPLTAINGYQRPFLCLNSTLRSLRTLETVEEISPQNPWTHKFQDKKRPQLGPHKLQLALLSQDPLCSIDKTGSNFRGHAQSQRVPPKIAKSQPQASQRSHDFGALWSNCRIWFQAARSEDSACEVVRTWIAIQCHAWLHKTGLCASGMAQASSHPAFLATSPAKLTYALATNYYVHTHMCIYIYTSIYIYMPETYIYCKSGCGWLKFALSNFQWKKKGHAKGTLCKKITTFVGTTLLKSSLGRFFLKPYNIS